MGSYGFTADDIARVQARNHVFRKTPLFVAEELGVPIPTQVKKRDVRRVLKAAKAATAPDPHPLVGLCRAAGLPKPRTEYYFALPQREWRADYCFVDRKVIVEIDGGAYIQGRHTRGAGFIEDQKKKNAAVLLGYLVLSYTPDRLTEAVFDLRTLFGLTPNNTTGDPARELGPKSPDAATHKSRSAVLGRRTERALASSSDRSVATID